MKRRNTEIKSQVLALLKNSDSALSHDFILEKLPQHADRATIYRILNSFCQDKIVHKIMGDNGKAYFKFCTACNENKHRHNHFHFRCTTCGTMECLETEMKISIPNGYQFENFNGIISGVCRNCALVPHISPTSIVV